METPHPKDSAPPTKINPFSPLSIQCNPSSHPRGAAGGCCERGGKKCWGAMFFWEGACFAPSPPPNPILTVSRSFFPVFSPPTGCGSLVLSVLSWGKKNKIKFGCRCFLNESRAATGPPLSSPWVSPVRYLCPPALRFHAAASVTLCLVVMESWAASSFLRRGNKVRGV